MAEHFLDTETRAALPLTALCALDAGLSVPEARDVWRYEVTPAVGLNMLSVAGEWAGWPEDWLLERIRAARAAGLVKRCWYRVFARINASSWKVIERCMSHLLSVEADKRAQRAHDLAALGRLAFEHGDAVTDEATRARLRGLYPEPFLTLLASEFHGGERDLRGML